jgi:hypothetical protein
MSNIDFTLQLDQAGSPGNGARMWLDSSRDGSLQPGEEVTLTTLDGKLWIASKSVSGVLSGMPFLVKFIAPIGTTWSFAATAAGTSLFAVNNQVTAVQIETLTGKLQ